MSFSYEHKSPDQMTAQERAIQLISVRLFSISLYREIIEQYRAIIRGEDTEKIKETYYPSKYRQWFIDVLWECGEGVR